MLLDPMVANSFCNCPLAQQTGHFPRAAWRPQPKWQRIAARLRGNVKHAESVVWAASSPRGSRL